MNNEVPLTIVINAPDNQVRRLAECLIEWMTEKYQYADYKIKPAKNKDGSYMEGFSYVYLTFEKKDDN
jgi:hypothetical protein